MRGYWTRLVIGLILVAAGILFLLQNFNLVVSAWALLWGLIFFAGGVVFLWVYVRDRNYWWPLIPGLALLAIGAITILESLYLGVAGNIAGAIFLGGIGIAFIVIYVNHPRLWWAIIPAGVLLSLALTTALFGNTDDPFSGGVFLIGLGLTFGAVYLLPRFGSHPRPTWALIAAAVLIFLGLISLSTSTSAAFYIWPAALIAAGLFIIYRILRPRRA